jgi:ubiquinone/menaquinone biosynthesis C-methylase UbiE
LFRQFGGPEGALLGRLAALLMARKNGPSNRWVVDLLEIRPDDRVLDVGFGPGLALALAAERALRGLVCGLDHSALMVRRAGRRLHHAIAAGRVEVREGSVLALPFPDASFTRALSVNSLQFWPSAEQGLGEIARVLERDGRLVLGLRMQQEGVGRFDRRRHGFTPERVAEIVETLARVGFAKVETLERELAGETLTAVLARKG